MDCPTCKEPLVRGEVRLGYSLGGFLLAGWSMLTVYFHAPGAKRRAVLEKNRSRAAELCERCGTLVVTSDRPRQSS